MDYKKKYLKYKLKYLTAKKLFGGSRSKKSEKKESIKKKKEIDSKVKTIKKKPEVTKLEKYPEGAIEKMEKNLERLDIGKAEIERRTAATQLSNVQSPRRPRRNAVSSNPPGTPNSDLVAALPDIDFEKRAKQIAKGHK